MQRIVNRQIKAVNWFFSLFLLCSTSPASVPHFPVSLRIDFIVEINRYQTISQKPPTWGPQSLFCTHSNTSTYPPPIPHICFHTQAMFCSSLLGPACEHFELSPNGYSDVSESVVVERTCCHGDAAMHKAPRRASSQIRTVAHPIAQKKNKQST